MGKRASAPQDNHDIPSGHGLTVGVVVSDWNKEITDALLDGCLETLMSNDVGEADIRVHRVPGSFELPLGARLMSASQKFDAIICLGCIIKGETRHDEYIAQSVATGIMQLGLMSSMPVIFGVLTPDNMEQARARSGGDRGNKGEDAAIAALRMAALRRASLGKSKKIGYS